MLNDGLRDSLDVQKDDAGSPVSIKGEDVVAESIGNLPSTYFQLAQTNRYELLILQGSFPSGNRG